MAKTALAAHFARRGPVVREIYDRLVEAAEQFGPVRQDPKKTSIHLARRTAFAGVATEPVIVKCRFARPPRGGVACPARDATSPLSSKRSSVA
jgi:hypothetical protein